MPPGLRLCGERLRTNESKIHFETVVDGNGALLPLALENHSKVQPPGVWPIVGERNRRTDIPRRINILTNRVAKAGRLHIHPQIGNSVGQCIRPIGNFLVTI